MLNEEQVADADLVKYIEDKSLIIRDKRIMLDKNVAAVYGVETRRLNEQRSRNTDKFPEDFAFQLTDTECVNLQSQNATSISSMSRINPWAYTLEGINMAATILQSEYAIRRSVQIIRIFSDLERMAHGEEPKAEETTIGDDEIIDEEEPEAEASEEQIADADLRKYIEDKSTVLTKNLVDEDGVAIIRDERVMLDRDVAAVYGVTTKRLNQQRERNPDKFPPDFAFQLSDEELRSQNATAISPMSRYNPWAYTLEGINQSANILNSPEANRRSVQIIRIFSDLERMAHGEEPKDDRMWTVIQR